MKPEYKRDFVNSYMILPMQNHFTTENYQFHVITKQIVPGLLSTKVGHDETEGYFYYEISGKNNLKRLFEHKKLSYVKLKNLLLQIRDIYNRCHEYLLDEEFLILDPEFIYLDIREFAVFMVPYPEYVCKPREQLEHFAEFLLEIIDYEEEKTVELALAFYEYALQENFTWSSFLTSILENEQKQTVVEEQEGSVPRDSKIDTPYEEPVRVREESFIVGPVTAKVKKPERRVRIGILMILLLVLMISYQFLSYYAFLLELSITVLGLFFSYVIRHQAELYLILEEEDRD